MKFIHIADVHLGVTPDAGKAYSQNRPQEIWETFRDVIALCEEEQTDLLLIAGDLFHRQPLLRELKEVDSLFASLSHTQVVLIAGNHDFIGKDSFYRSYQWHENVYPLFGSQISSVLPKGMDTAVYGFSYYDREILSPRYDEAKPEHRARYEILLAHGGDDRHIPIQKEALSRSGFDYVALGHIHKAQTAITDRALYAGALEPTDINDTGPHGLIRGELTEAGLRTEFVPFAKREYIHLGVKVDETMTSNRVRNAIEKVIRERGEQNLYRFVLRGYRDPDIHFETDTMDSFGNIIAIEDETKPALDLERIYERNKGNIIGQYMEMFQDCDKDSVEYQALLEGTQALVESMENEGDV